MEVDDDFEDTQITFTKINKMKKISSNRELYSKMNEDE